jgi:hypothetical protein
MAITIEEPAIEGWLQREAARRGVTPAELVRELLALHQPPREAQPDDWMQAFNAWVDSHPRRAPLPADAFTRDNFYTEVA